MKNKITLRAPSFMSLLFLLFLYLKLTGHIAWSWWIVTLPLWGGIAILLTIIAILLTIMVIVVGVSALINK